MGEASFIELRRLSDWFAALSSSPSRHALSIERVVIKLGATCVPLLGRELRARDARRRDAARAALARLALTTDARTRTIAELRAIAGARDACDDAKAAALGLLAELGITSPRAATASFADPIAIRARCASALAAQLDTAAEVAAAAALVLDQLAVDEIPRVVDALAASSPIAAARLGAELRARLDVPDELCEALAALPPAPAPRGPRIARATVLVDAGERTVVVASAKVSGERRWRRWAVLVGAHGRIDDCVHDDRATTDADVDALVASLIADGYRATTSDLEHARTTVAAAAARTGSALPAPYYLGRDLLDLGDVHLRAERKPSPLARAVEAVADHEPARARALLAGPAIDANDPSVAATLAAAALALDDNAAAIAHLERACEGEPEWPLHHWNLAVARLRVADPRGAHAALCRFAATSAAPPARCLAGDPDQPGRVALAERLLADLERAARLAGAPLKRKRRRRLAAGRAALT